MSEDFNKYLAIANHDIQMAKNMGELKSYVASILYDNDKKVDMIHELEEETKELQDKIERLNNIIKNIENICESSIASVDNILQDEKETKIVNGRCINRNEYQIVRLKAYRTKSKEILGRIKELKGSVKE